jgi:hypothetical protein
VIPAAPAVADPAPPVVASGPVETPAAPGGGELGGAAWLAEELGLPGSAAATVVPPRHSTEIRSRKASWTITIQVVAGLGVLGIVAVGAVLVRASHHPRPSAPALASATVSPTAYVADVRAAAQGSLLKSAPDADIVALGQGVCTKLNVSTPSQVEASMLAAGHGATFPNADAVTIIDDAGRDLCPDHAADVSAWSPLSPPAPVVTVPMAASKAVPAPLSDVSRR